MRYLLFLVPAYLVILGCAESDPEPRRIEPHAVATSPRSSKLSRQQQLDVQIPADVHYAIINESTLPGIKRSLDVRLNKRISEDVLTTIAYKLQQEDSRQYRNTFICYYLEDMKVGAGAWATSHFTPDLEVRILGMTEEQHRILGQVSSEEIEGEMLGQWLDERPFVSSRTTIMKIEDTWFLMHEYPDGSSNPREIIERDSHEGRRFEWKESLHPEDYWIIDSNGNLLICDNDGIIAIAKPIR